jgi:hypothetical protein
MKSEGLVLVDTSAWIDFWNGSEKARREILTALLGEDRAAVNPVIRMEALTGARDEAQYRFIGDSFGGIDSLALTDEVFRLGERLRFELARKGTLVPIPDVIIAACAIVHRVMLLERDKHFQVIARHDSRLKLYGS